MKVIYSILIIFFVFQTAASANGIDSKGIELKFYVRNAETKNPTYELSFFENGKEIAKRIFKGGKTILEEGQIPDGVVIERYDSGKPKNILVFKNGKRNGKAIAFYESGRLKKTVTFKDDNPVGESKMYYENGNVMMESKTEDGKQVFYRDYYPNGQLKQEVYYKGDEIVRRMYDIHGKVID
jgi:antitoxin component YwqK of YwqJK toxin-antitoxin module